ncbi:A disintegrin and metalloproteinase with thrombospondin motifs 1-like [Leptopilina boulardi]|uniref:A disintegrin and metalloproteinase with thrombospondin motifs 1-like n=1 Tax=Leptopilina boulardi TaxID=63433 RepID=UPI0021F649E4|nr:A disintegrin and metalloproteinase with thrombospondin motifs 1-like [Leptopilina boulardi]
MLLYHIFFYIILSPLVYSFLLRETLTHDKIVYPIEKRINKRSTEKIITIPYDNGKNIDLYLQPADSTLIGTHTMVWMTKSDKNSPNGYRYHLIPNAIKNLKDFYVDDKNNATVYLTTDEDGNLIMQGTIGDEITIQPLPDDDPRNRKLSTNYYDSSMKMRPHIINAWSYSEKNNMKKIKLYKKEKSLEKKDENLYTNTKNSKISTVYPELLIYIDETLFIKFDKDIQRTLKYIITTYYGVDLRYRDFQHPKIRFRINGIVIVNNAISDMLPGVETNGTRPEKLLEEFSFHLGKMNRKFRFTKNYDIAVFMTGSIMIQSNGIQVYGRAYVGQACKKTIEDWKEMIKATAIVADNGAYSGIHVATHELGHVFGANHLNGDNSECALGENGDIMSYYGQFINRIKFSPCSRRVISKFLRSENAKCLRNNPLENEPMTVPLPGRFMTMDEQCLREAGTKACYHRIHNDTRRCIKLICNGRPGFEHDCDELFFPPAEGTICGKNKACIKGQCIRYFDSSNAILEVEV